MYSRVHCDKTDSIENTVTLEQRIDTLESVRGQFIVLTDTILNRLARSLEEFKDKMSRFRIETNKKVINKAIRIRRKRNEEEGGSFGGLHKTKVYG